MIVEDDPAMSDFLNLTLSAYGYTLSLHAATEAALKELRCSRPDLIILDINLIGSRRCGLHICEVVKDNPRTKWMPIMVLTGWVLEEMKRTAALVGADQYFAKPIDGVELADWVDTLIELGKKRAKDDGILRVGDFLVVYEQEAEAEFRNRRLELSPGQFKLLVLLARHAGTTVSREHLMQRLWTDPIRKRQVDCAVSRLAKKFGPVGRKLIVPDPGVGYRLATYLPVDDA